MGPKPQTDESDSETEVLMGEQEEPQIQSGEEDEVSEGQRALFFSYT